MGKEKFPDSCDWCGKEFSLYEKDDKSKNQRKKGNHLIILCDTCSPDVQRRVSSDNGDAVLDVPHNPDAEAALIQETRERISVLQAHLPHPEAVASLEKFNEDLYALMANVSQTDEYNCNCLQELRERQYDD